MACEQPFVAFHADRSMMVSMMVFHKFVYRLNSHCLFMIHFTASCLGSPDSSPAIVGVPIRGSFCFDSALRGQVRAPFCLAYGFPVGVLICRAFLFLLGLDLGIGLGRFRRSAAERGPCRAQRPFRHNRRLAKCQLAAVFPGSSRLACPPLWLPVCALSRMTGPLSHAA